ncbi:hypothetical protein [Nonomuraea aridisoli]|uniref:Uncharacterized protein n=1 Tax=Nonomuraea aridisoli TaxID=2070368 RepID=A0A2W2E900_9ACTN|nr:hypothetical protein [Nonomuraea aridisoli]PZG20592.1 hypothetical protein C1J01_08800 [Nonomuraea aridisoli]
MEGLLQLPIVQGGAVVVLLAIIWLIATGRLVPRSTLEDVRADRDARLREAAADAEEWRTLWQKERDAHELTREAHARELRAALAASNEGAQIAVALLTELRGQIEAKP